MLAIDARLTEQVKQLLKNIERLEELTRKSCEIIAANERADKKILKQEISHDETPAH